MAKEILSYECEICGQLYLTNEGAEDCSKNHYVDLEVDSMTYEAHKLWPKSLTLVNPMNGTKQVYVKA